MGCVMEEKQNCNGKENRAEKNIENRVEMPFINIFGQVVNEKTFAMGQKIMPGFALDLKYNYSTYKSLICAKEQDKTLSVYEESKLIFPLIFGAFGCEQNLSEAMNLVCRLLGKVNQAKPTEDLTC